MHSQYCPGVCLNHLACYGVGIADFLTINDTISINDGRIKCQLVFTSDNHTGLLRQLLQKHAASTRQLSWLLMRLSVLVWQLRV